MLFNLPDNYSHQILPQHIDQAKSVPLESLVDMELRRTSKGFMSQCPFHEDMSPSFHIYTDSNSYYCFGCHESGDAISYVSKINGLTFPETIRKLTHF